MKKYLLFIITIALILSLFCSSTFAVDQNDNSLENDEQNARVICFHFVTSNYTLNSHEAIRGSCYVYVYKVKYCSICGLILESKLTTAYKCSTHP